MSRGGEGRALAKPGGTITLRNVAERSGVSITTVSRILNGRDTGVPVRDETRERITNLTIIVNSLVERDLGRSDGQI